MLIKRLKKLLWEAIKLSPPGKDGIAFFNLAREVVLCLNIKGLGLKTQINVLGHEYHWAMGLLFLQIQGSIENLVIHLARSIN